MPLIRRNNSATLHYRIDDHTDPWKNAGTIVLQHGYARSSRFWLIFHLPCKRRIGISIPTMPLSIPSR